MVSPDHPDVASAADRFATATAVQRTDATDRSTVRFTATVHDGWDIGGNANGGYVLAMAARAMSEVVDRQPLTITAHYLKPVPAGVVTIDVNPVRIGRRMATATATMYIGDAPVLQLLGTFGSHTPGGPSLHTEDPVDLPPYDECAEPPGPDTGVRPALMGRLASRLRPGDEGFRDGAPTGPTELRGWFAFRDEEPIDAFGLLLAADAFPPPVFNSGLPIGWVPTVELTVHVRAEPAPGPLRCRFRSRFIADGLLDEDGEIWDSMGRIVAQSRQLALLPR